MLEKREPTNINLEAGNQSGPDCDHLYSTELNWRDRHCVRCGDSIRSYPTMFWDQPDLNGMRWGGRAL